MSLRPVWVTQDLIPSKILKINNHEETAYVSPGVKWGLLLLLFACLSCLVFFLLGNLFSGTEGMAHLFSIHGARRLVPGLS